MAGTTKKSKAKASSATAGRTTKAKAKAKPVKVKKVVAKTSKAKPTKAKSVKKPVSKTPAKKSAAKTKVASKPISAPSKITVSKTTKAKVKTKSAPPAASKERRPEPIAIVAADVAVIAAPEYVPPPAIEPAPEASEPYMDAEQLQHFKSLLWQWKRELMEEVDHTITEMKEAGVMADPNDCATQEETFSLELRTRDRERKLLKKIEEALQKIEDEEYGYCDTCGVEIGVRRLEARPTATLCIDCKTLDEIKEKRA